MPKLPQVSGKETIKALQKIRFNIVHQRGSHVKLARIANDQKQTVIVPLQKAIKKELCVMAFSNPLIFQLMILLSS